LGRRRKTVRTAEKVAHALTPPSLALAALQKRLKASEAPEGVAHAPDRERPRLWVPDEGATAASSAQPAPVAPAGADTSLACELCDVATGAWRGGGAGDAAEACQALCAGCRVWRRFPRVGHHANLSLDTLPQPRAR